MAHFAEMDGNVVLRVIVVDNNKILNEGGQEIESIGIDYLEGLFGHRNWKQTSYNTHGGSHSQGKPPMKMNYAGIGYIWSSTKLGFHAPSPYPSWVLRNSTLQWGAPVPYPDDGNDYEWDEATISWVLV